MNAILRLTLFSFLGIFAAIIAAASRFHIMLEYFNQSPGMETIAWLGIVEFLLGLSELPVGEQSLHGSLLGWMIYFFLFAIFNPITGGIIGGLGGAAIGSNYSLGRRITFALIGGAIIGVLSVYIETPFF